MSRRFFRHGELPLVLLAVLERRPMLTYELMSEINRLFAPAYVPSPGAVYPAVDALEVEGLIESADEGGRVTYGVTGTGRRALESRRAALADLELRTGVRLSRQDDIEGTIDRHVARVRLMVDKVDATELESILDEAAELIKERIETYTPTKAEVTGR